MTLMTTANIVLAGVALALGAFFMAPTPANAGEKEGCCKTCSCCQDSCDGCKCCAEGAACCTTGCCCKK